MYYLNFHYCTYFGYLPIVRCFYHKPALLSFHSYFLPHHKSMQIFMQYIGSVSWILYNTAQKIKERLNKNYFSTVLLFSCWMERTVALSSPSDPTISDVGDTDYMIHDALCQRHYIPILFCETTVQPIFCTRLHEISSNWHLKCKFTPSYLCIIRHENVSKNKHFSLRGVLSDFSCHKL